MSMIRRYAQFPAMFVPDVGEVVKASRSPGGPFLKAVVTHVHRTAEDFIRVDFEWLESADVTPTGTGARAGEKANAYIRRDDKVPLIRRLPGDRQGGS